MRAQHMRSLGTQSLLLRRIWNQYCYLENLQLVGHKNLIVDLVLESRSFEAPLLGTRMLQVEQRPQESHRNKKSDEDW